MGDDKLELERGGWVTFADPEDVTMGERLAMQRAYKAGDDSVEKVYNLATAMASALITGWSLELPLPSADPAVFEKVRARDWDAIQTHLLGLENRMWLNLDIDPKDGSPT